MDFQFKAKAILSAAKGQKEIQEYKKHNSLFSHFRADLSKEQISEDIFDTRYCCQICCEVLKKDKA